MSLWSYTNSQLEAYKNPLYWDECENGGRQRVLVPVASIRHIKLWKAYYCRWNLSMRTQDPVHHRIREMLRLKQQLEQKVNPSILPPDVLLMLTIEYFRWRIPLRSNSRGLPATTCRRRDRNVHSKQFFN